MAGRDSYPPAKRARVGPRDPPPKKPRYTYSEEESKRDDRAYAAGRSTSGFRSKRSNGPKRRPNELPINELKSKIRDTKRVLDRSDKLPVDVRIEKERALKGYEMDLERAEERKAKSSMIGKYHFVRFLERKTATTKLKRLLREKSEIEEAHEADQAKESKSSEETVSSPGRARRLKELEDLISMARIDIDYTIYSPLTEKYISLYPKKNKEGEDGKSAQAEPHVEDIIRSGSGEKPPLWYTVRECKEDGTLDLLRDGKLGVGLSGEIKNKSETGGLGSGMGLAVHSKRDKRTGGDEDHHDDDDDDDDDDEMSDGGVPLGGGAGRKHGRNDGRAMDDGDESDGGFFET